MTQPRLNWSGSGGRQRAQHASQGLETLDTEGPPRALPCGVHPGATCGSRTSGWSRRQTGAEALTRVVSEYLLSTDCEP